MEIQLPSALATFVHEQVESGRYRDETEVVSAALRLLDRHALDPLWADIDGYGEFSPDRRELNAALDEGEADLAAGRSSTFENAEELRAHLSGL